jgi:hypothetical protein
LITRGKRNTTLEKKKDHTFKNQIITLPKGKDLVDVQVGELGKTPDVTIFREQKQVFASTQSFQGDKGYVGEPQIRTPHKKQKNQVLTEEKKQENKALSTSAHFCRTSD